MNSGASDTKHTRKTKGRATRTPLKLEMNSGASDTKHTRKTKGRFTRWVPLVEQKLLIHQRHMSSSPVFSGVRVARPLVLSVCFVSEAPEFIPSFSGVRVARPLHTLKIEQHEPH
jgi:hypothetical protein